jgi:hypothetical protein
LKKGTWGSCHQWIKVPKALISHSPTSYTLLPP